LPFAVLRLPFSVCLLFLLPLLWGGGWAAAQPVDAMVCVGKSFSITTGAVPPSGQGELAFKWYVDGQEAPGATAERYTATGGYSLPGVHEFVRWVQAGTCTPEVTAPYRVKVVKPTEVPVITASTPTVCRGGNVIFTATSSVSGATYTWCPAASGMLNDDDNNSDPVTPPAGTPGTPSGSDNSIYTKSTAGVESILQVTVIAKIPAGTTQCPTDPGSASVTVSDCGGG
jgi:hypothetical protein